MLKANDDIPLNLFNEPVSLLKPIHYLTWHQPFCSLMLHGKLETRSEPTNVRGKVLMLSSKTPYETHELFDMCGPKTMIRIANTLAGDPTWNVTGHAIALGDLVGCRVMTRTDEWDCFIKYKDPWLVQAGKDKYRQKVKRLWVWEFKNVQRIEPFEIKGKQGWGIIDDQDVLRKIRTI